MLSAPLHLSHYHFHLFNVPVMAAATIRGGVNHVFIVDCSGSMHSELPPLRDHIKTKLIKLLNAKDTLSILWFSSNGQFGVVIEGKEVSTLTDLSEVHRAIDRGLVARGATSFTLPINEAKKLIERQSANGNSANVMFLSDGYHNDGSREEVLAAAQALAPYIDCGAVVEYGYYADRGLLAKIADAWGAPVLFAKQLCDYRPAIERAVTRVITGQFTRVSLGATAPISGLVVGLAGRDPVAYTVQTDSAGSFVSLPQGVGAVGWLVGAEARPVSQAAAAQPKLDPEFYALMGVLALRGTSAPVLDMLATSGDVALINAYSSCFGKQAISDFAEKCTATAVGEAPPYSQGFNAKYAPSPDAATIPELLTAIENLDLRVEVDLSEYKRISRERVDANLRLTADEQAELDTLKQLLEGEKDAKKVVEVSARIAALANKPEPLKFVEEATVLPGYPLNGMVFNEDRPNISFRVVRNGFVDLSARIPPHLVGKVPEKFPTFTFRNYNVARDGIVNISKIKVLPNGSESNFSCFVSMLASLNAQHRLKPNVSRFGDGFVELELASIPLVNARQVLAPSAVRLAEVAVRVLEAQAGLKVLKALHKDVHDKKSEGFEALYGSEAAKWLSEQGIVSYSGFNPKVLQVESKDSYETRTLKVKIAGYSSLPSLKDAKEKNTPSAMLMKPTISAWENLNLTKPENKARIEAQIERLTNTVREGQLLNAQQKYACLVGNAWFKEFASFDENVLEVKFSNGRCAKAVFELTTVTEKI